jgi:hypothetical protein
MADYIPNKNLSEESQLLLMEAMYTVHLEQDVRLLLEFLRVKYNIGPNEKFRCPYFQKLAEDYKVLVETRQKLIDLRPDNDW